MCRPTPPARAGPPAACLPVSAEVDPGGRRTVTGRGVRAGPAGPAFRPARPARTARTARDGGAAVAEFVMVSAVLLFTALGVAQVALVLHVRNVVTADAAEGARHAATLGAPPAGGGPYAESLLRGSVPGAARGLRCVSAVERAAVELVAVSCRGRVALSLLPLGFSVPISLTAHAVRERAP